jgi:hypothetical protein
MREVDLKLETQHKFCVGMVKCPSKTYEGGRPETQIQLHTALAIGNL